MRRGARRYRDCLELFERNTDVARPARNPDFVTRRRRGRSYRVALSAVTLEGCVTDLVRPADLDRSERTGAYEFVRRLVMHRQLRCRGFEVHATTPVTM